MRDARCGGSMLAATALLVAAAGPAWPHQGPPFPIVSDRTVGAYRVSVWTDPDATDDGSPGGQFWIIVHAADGSETAAGTRVHVACRPVDRPGAVQQAGASAQPGDRSRYFAGLVLDHEGTWDVQVSLDGPSGAAFTSAAVAATYDLRPPVAVLPFLVLPFVLVGLLWFKALRVRSRSRRP